MGVGETDSKNVENGRHLVLNKVNLIWSTGLQPIGETARGGTLLQPTIETTKQYLSFYKFSCNVCKAIFNALKSKNSFLYYKADDNKLQLLYETSFVFCAIWQTFYRRKVSAFELRYYVNS